MPPLPDAPDQPVFVITLPVTWSGDLVSIRLDGRDRSAMIDLDTNEPMTILRDASSGQVTGHPGRARGRGDGPYTGVPLEVFQSFGVARH